MLLIILALLMNCILCCTTKHPLTLGFVLLMQTILTALVTGLMAPNFWSSYIIFLVMIGGMLILFTYMTSIASNEKFKFSSKLMLFLVMASTMSALMYISMDNFFLFTQFKMMDLSQMNMNNINQMNLNKFLNYPHLLIYLMIIIYLLITLIAVVNMTKKTAGALRQKF